MKTGKQPLTSTREFVELLWKEKELWIIEDEVDPNLELAQIQREVCAKKGPALLFTNVKGTNFPVATNLYGSCRRMELAFGDRSHQFIKDLVNCVEELMPPSLSKLWQAKDVFSQGLKIGTKKRKTGPVFENSISPVDLTKLPQIKSWPEDGGAFVTLPLVYTESPVTGKGNLGMYRVQLFDERNAGMHIQIHRGGGFHYFEAEQRNQPLPASLFIGGPPAMTIASIAPLPEDVPELLFASLLMGKKLDVRKPKAMETSIVLESDFCVQGLIQPHKRRPEGPFGDHYGYYSLQHDYPYMEVNSIHHRANAIYPATVVGRPPQEDHYIAEFLQDIMEPLFPMVMPNVKKVWAYEESGVHSMAGAIVKDRYHKEAFTAALRILSEGHLSLTKFLLVTDQDINLKNFKELFLAVLERVDFRKDLFVLSNISQDTLDYTGPKVNEGSKAILMGVGEKINQLKEEFNGDFVSNSFKNPSMFCPGALCVSGDSYQLKANLAEDLLNEPAIQGFKMVFLLDDAKEATKSNEDFIWHVFTRFEPAADIYGKQTVSRFHVGIEGTVVVDCRMKPWYPSTLEEVPEVVAAVREKWGKQIDLL